MGVTFEFQLPFDTILRVEDAILASKWLEHGIKPTRVMSETIIEITEISR